MKYGIIEGGSPVELRQFLYAVQIAAEKNFTRAAEKLHIAQPSLSQQVAKLEKELGVLLFQRNTSNVELTYAGTQFVAKAQAILDLVDQLKKEMEDISQMKRGKLIIGSLPITGSHILPLVLPVFQSAYPDIDIVLVEDTTSNLESLTVQGKTDLSLLTLPLLEQSLHYEPLIEEEIYAALPPNHADAGKSRLPLAKFKDEPFILLKRGQGFRQIAVDLCAQAGFSPNVVFESSNIETVQSLVAAGMGISLVPKMVAKTRGSEFTPAYVSLEGEPTRTVVIAYKKDRYLSKAAEAFMKTVADVLQ